jgi:hypothetical protein
MTTPVRNTTPPLHPNPAELFAPFPPADDLPAFEVVPADQVPTPYDALLVHEYHMTVTVEAHHEDMVNVRVLDRRQVGDWYTRKIVLELRTTGQRVLFGIVRVNLSMLPPAVRDEIVKEKSPFGRVLIRHNVLRTIEPTAYLRIVPGPRQLAWFGLDAAKELYGRLAIIHCNHQPAVELFEVVAPA